MNTQETKQQETEVWWGGYSPWTMTPSFSVAIALTGVIVWWGWNFLERGDIRLGILSLTGFVWFVQLLRFGYRFFGANYHLTTRRLMQETGLMNKTLRMVWLDKVESVVVERSNLEEFLGVGRVVIQSVEKEPPMIWKGVRNCNAAAERIRVMVEKVQSK